MPPLLRRLGGLHFCAGHHLRETGGELDIRRSLGEARTNRTRPRWAQDRFSILNSQLQETPPPAFERPLSCCNRTHQVASRAVFGGDGGGEGKEEEEEKASLRHSDRPARTLKSEDGGRRFAHRLHLFFGRRGSLSWKSIRTPAGLIFFVCRSLTTIASFPELSCVARASPPHVCSIQCPLSALVFLPLYSLHRHPLVEALVFIPVPALTFSAQLPPWPTIPPRVWAVRPATAEDN